MRTGSAWRLENLIKSLCSPAFRICVKCRGVDPSGWQYTNKSDERLYVRSNNLLSYCLYSLWLRMSLVRSKISKILTISPLLWAVKSPWKTETCVKGKAGSEYTILGQIISFHLIWNPFNYIVYTLYKRKCSFNLKKRKHPRCYLYLSHRDKDRSQTSHTNGTLLI